MDTVLMLIVGYPLVGLVVSSLGLLAGSVLHRDLGPWQKLAGCWVVGLLTVSVFSYYTQ